MEPASIRIPAPGDYAPAAASGAAAAVARRAAARRARSRGAVAGIARGCAAGRIIATCRCAGCAADNWGVGCVRDGETREGTERMDSARSRVDDGRNYGPAGRRVTRCTSTSLGTRCVARYDDAARAQPVSPATCTSSRRACYVLRAMSGTAARCALLEERLTLAFRSPSAYDDMISAVVILN